MVWLAGRRWWLLAVAFVLLLLGVVLSISILYVIPGVLLVFLLLFAILMVLTARRGSPRPPRSN
jgi:hypothetical protein